MFLMKRDLIWFRVISVLFALIICMAWVWIKEFWWSVFFKVILPAPFFILYLISKKKCYIMAASGFSGLSIIFSLIFCLVENFHKMWSIMMLAVDSVAVICFILAFIFVNDPIKKEEYTFRKESSN